MFKGHCFPKDIILQAVYYKLRFSLSYRDIEELLAIRGVEVDHATIQRWVFKFSPLVEATFRKRKKRVGKSWRVDETYINVKGVWKYLYRGVDKQGFTIDFLLTNKRDLFAAHKFLLKAIASHGKPAVINIDKSGTNKEAIMTCNRRSMGTKSIKIRQCKFLNNIIEQDHRFVKWRIQQGLGFKNFDSASRTIGGIEVVRMIKKGQLKRSMETTFDSFCSLAA